MITINKLRIKANFNVKYRTTDSLTQLRNMGVFDKCFVTVEETNTLHIIKSKNIILKCIIQRNKKRAKVQISEFIIANEHD